MRSVDESGDALVIDGRIWCVYLVNVCGCVHGVRFRSLPCEKLTFANQTVVDRLV